MSFFRRRFPKAFKVVGRDPADYAQEFQEFVDQSINIGEGLPAGFGDVDARSIQAGVAADPGDPSLGWMAVDATIPIETATATGLSNTNSEGTGTALARAGHTHKRDVRIAYDGIDIGTRNRINFVSTGGVPTDDPGNDEVDVPLAQTFDVEVVASGPYSLNTTTDLGKVFTNEGAGAEVEFDLPAAAVNLFYIFAVQDADGMQINAQGGDTIRFETTVSAAGGGIQSVTPGASMLLLAINSTEWVALYYIPTWTTVAPAAAWNNNWWGPPVSMYFG